jgi:hypothetical protein
VLRVVRVPLLVVLLLPLVPVLVLLLVLQIIHHELVLRVVLRLLVLLLLVVLLLVVLLLLVLLLQVQVQVQVQHREELSETWDTLFVGVYLYVGVISYRSMCVCSPAGRPAGAEKHCIVSFGEEVHAHAHERFTFFCRTCRKLNIVT